MPVQPVLILLVVAVLANLVLMGALLVPPLLGRRPLFASEDAEVQAPPRSTAELGALIGGTAGQLFSDGVPVSTYDRVVRIVSWAFILATSTIVAVTGLWPQNQPAIFILLGAAGVFVLVVHDILPIKALGSARFVLEGSAAITFVTLLVMLTGQERSPFFFAFPLIVAGAALVVTPRITLVLAAFAAAGYLAAVLSAPDRLPPTPQESAEIGVNLIAMALLAYVATVIAREQRQARDAAIRLSAIDSLTSLFNRAFFFAAVDREIQRSARSGRGFCLLMMDLDGLKAVNDRFGHFMGDRALRAVGHVIRTGVRRIDTAARYGGDEFVVLLPETDPTGAFVVAEKIRQGVADLSVDGATQQVRTSLSIGVVGYPDDGRTADELMISADKAMYASKRQGKNKVVTYAGAVTGDLTDDSV